MSIAQKWIFLYMLVVGCVFIDVAAIVTYATHHEWQLTTCRLEMPRTSLAPTLSSPTAQNDL